MAAFSIMFNSLGNAKVAELADAPDLGSGTERCGGSSPPFRIMLRGNQLDCNQLDCNQLGCSQLGCNQLGCNQLCCENSRPA
jgi:hypothetical protein